MKYWASQATKDEGSESETEDGSLQQPQAEDIPAEEEKMGLTVKVTGIKLRNPRSDSDLVSEGEMADEQDLYSGLADLAKKSDGEQQDYYMWDKPLSSMEVTIVSFENNPSMRNHIIVCGVPSSIKSFIKPLRARYLAEYQLQKVVLITGQTDSRDGDQIDSKIWG